jgi:tetratricopeptide (TPR) repeat protein
MLLLAGCCLVAPLLAQGHETPAANDLQIDQPLFKPFVERYILDELKLLRQEQQAMKAQVVEQVANARIDASDRAMRYTADTTANIFYIITLAASILVLLGWKSLRDIKENIEEITTRRVEELTQRYEERLNALEATLRERSNEIVAAQKELADTNLVHSLWMRAGLAKSEQEKINIYDQILEISPQDVEALTHKADVLLDLDEDSWALSLVNQAIDIDSDYAQAYWQRACAQAKLENNAEAIEDIRTALSLSAAWKDELAAESYFVNLKDEPAFRELAKS